MRRWYIYEAELQDEGWIDWVMAETAAQAKSKFRARHSEAYGLPEDSDVQLKAVSAKTLRGLAMKFLELETK